MEGEYTEMTEPEPLPDEVEDGVVHIPVIEDGGESAEEQSSNRTPVTDDDLIKALRQQMIRLQADFDNYRRRTLRDQGKQRRDAEDALLSKILPVVDDFEMGLAAARDHGVPESAIEGFELICNQLTALLNDYDVRPLEAVGKEFDPHWYESVGQEPSNTCPEGCVTRETRRGYARGGVLLRPSRVLVSSGAPLPGRDEA